MRIGELADRVGVNPKTIRYYEGIGLLPDPERLPSGYRHYTDEDVDRLGFVRTAQRLGLSLSEIAEILGFRERAERPCQYVLGVLDRQVADLDRRMAEMTRLRSELVALKEQADRLPPDADCYCAVIDHARGAGRSPMPSGGDGRVASRPLPIPSAEAVRRRATPPRPIEERGREGAPVPEDHSGLNPRRAG